MKLYIVVANDLNHGAQSAQAVHCAHQFSYEHPDIFLDWFHNSNTIVILSAPPERLESLLYFAESTSHFREPDFDDKLTAVALAPSALNASLCSDLPLQGHTTRSKILRKFYSKITTYLRDQGRSGGAIPSPATKP